jgi:hypothetical protein
MTMESLSTAFCKTEPMLQQYLKTTRTAPHFRRQPQRLTHRQRPQICHPIDPIVPLGRLRPAALPLSLQNHRLHQPSLTNLPGRPPYQIIQLSTQQFPFGPRFLLGRRSPILLQFPRCQVMRQQCPPCLQSLESPAAGPPINQQTLQPSRCNHRCDLV